MAYRYEASIDRHQNFTNRWVLLIPLLCFIFGLSAFAVPHTSVEKAKLRMEELFLWKVSDSLSLSAEKDEEFRTVFKSLNERKQKLALEQDQLVHRLEKELESKNLAKNLEDYRKSLEDLNRIQLEEAKSVRRILGDKKFALYLVLKRDLNQKLRNLLSTPSRQESNQPKD